MQMYMNEDNSTEIIYQPQNYENLNEKLNILNNISWY